MEKNKFPKDRREFETTIKRPLIYQYEWNEINFPGEVKDWKVLKEKAKQSPLMMFYHITVTE